MQEERLVVLNIFSPSSRFLCIDTNALIKWCTRYLPLKICKLFLRINPTRWGEGGTRSLTTFFTSHLRRPEPSLLLRGPSLLLFCSLTSLLYSYHVVEPFGNNKVIIVIFSFPYLALANFHYRNQRLNGQTNQHKTRSVRHKLKARKPQSTWKIWLIEP